MNQQPTYRSQGVNYLGFLAQQLGDLAGKTTLAHEIIQNADDAKDDSGRRGYASDLRRHGRSSVRQQ